MSPSVIYENNNESPKKVTHQCNDCSHVFTNFSTQVSFLPFSGKTERGKIRGFTDVDNKLEVGDRHHGGGGL